MKITHNKVGQNLNATDTQTEKASGASRSGDVKKNSNSTQNSTAGSAVGSPTTEATKVQLSPRVLDIKNIKELAKNAPDVDTDKVAKFKQMIAEGKYKVDAKSVADKMVDEHMKSHATEE